MYVSRLDTGTLYLYLPPKWPHEFLSISSACFKCASKIVTESDKKCFFLTLPNRNWDHQLFRGYIYKTARLQFIM